MKKSLFFILFIVVSSSLQAHNPQISTIIFVQNKNKQWNLLVGASLAAFQNALQNKGVYKPSEPIQAQAFQQLIEDQLRENIQIRANGDQAVALKKGLFILNHQTDVRFDLPEMPSHLQTLTISQRCFASLKNHYCLLKIYPDGGKARSFILQDSNQFTIALTLKDNTLIDIQPQADQGDIPWVDLVTASGLVWLLGAGIVLFKKRRSKPGVSSNAAWISL
ncbi:hypothetical protein [Spirosoma panaciterrae]|uniref:hypothetical protein n=1 Tax=Spirosoma panaciterrae TaxID=496058 RepID=UPI00037DEBE6|nr:hypothetical protein [Spirosoma panaciterrae]